MHNGIAKTKGFECAVGLFNGTGDNTQYSGEVLVNPDSAVGAVTALKGSNVPSLMRPLIVVLTGVNNLGKQMYDSVDLTGGALRAAVAANSMIYLDSPNQDNGSVVSGVNGMIKFEGLTV